MQRKRRGGGGYSNGEERFEAQYAKREDGRVKYCTARVRNRKSRFKQAKRCKECGKGAMGKWEKGGKGV